MDRREQRHQGSPRGSMSASLAEPVGIDPAGGSQALPGTPSAESGHPHETIPTQPFPGGRGLGTVAGWLWLYQLAEPAPSRRWWWSGEVEYLPSGSGAR